MEILDNNRKKGWRNRELVRQTDRRSIRNLWILLLGIVAALAPMAIYVIEQIQFVQVRYQIESVRKDHARFQEAAERYRVQRATLECPTRVAARARNLGLVEPSPDRIIIVGAEETVLEDLLARAPDDPSSGR